MKRYTDKSGRTWLIEITIGSVLRVKNALAVDLLIPEVGEPSLVSRLAADELLLGQVICELMRPQMEKEGVTAEQLLDAFDGATVAAATEAFFAEYADFFQSRGRRDRAAAVRKMINLMTAAINLAESKVKAVSLPPELSGATSGASPE